MLPYVLLGDAVISLLRRHAPCMMVALTYIQRACEWVLCMFCALFLGGTCGHHGVLYEHLPIAH